MLITLTPEREAWLQSQVATGTFVSIEEAARQLIDERIAERELERTSWPGRCPLWMRGWPRFGAARLSLLRHKGRNAARLAALKG
jgi:antitoxin ParD1/3/4